MTLPTTPIASLPRLNLGEILTIYRPEHEQYSTVVVCKIMANCFGVVYLSSANVALSLANMRKAHTKISYGGKVFGENAFVVERKNIVIKEAFPRDFKMREGLQQISYSDAIANFQEHYTKIDTL